MSIDIQENVPLIIEVDSSDEEALDLFNNLNHQSSEIMPQHQSHQQQQLQQYSQSQEDRPLRRLAKSKKENKHKKHNHKSKHNKSKHTKNQHSKLQKLSSPKKKIKRQNQDQEIQNEPEFNEEEALSHSELDEESQNQSKLSEHLSNLNPSVQDDKSPTKRLRKSNKKSRLQLKEGFNLNELGNDPEVDLDKLKINHDDDSLSGYSGSEDERKNRKKKKLREKKHVISNEDLIARLKENGVADSDNEDHEQEAGNYDNGFQHLYSMKQKKKSIKVANKLFGDLDIDLKDEENQIMPQPENLQLELKPKSSISISSSRMSFLNRAETIKKQRGLESTVNSEEYQRGLAEKAKKSMAKVVTGMMQTELHDELYVDVKVPNISRGKSADIINNTVFLKRSLFNSNRVEDNSLNEVNVTENLIRSRTTVSQSYTASSRNNKNGIMSRNAMYKDIMTNVMNRRSQYVSDQEIKNSFKKTNLEELEETRKKIEQKRRKEALSDQEDDEDFQAEGEVPDSEIQDFIAEKQRERIGREKQEQQSEDKNHKLSNNEINEKELKKDEEQKERSSHSLQNIEIEIEQGDEMNANEMSQKAKKMSSGNEMLQNEEQQMQISNNDEMIDELADVSESHRHQEQQNSKQQEGEEGDEGDEGQQEPMEEEIESEPELLASKQDEEQDHLDNGHIQIEENHRKLEQIAIEIRQLEDQGIVFKKKKYPIIPIEEPQEVQLNIHIQEIEIHPEKYQGRDDQKFIDKENQINRPNLQDNRTNQEKQQVIEGEQKITEGVVEQYKTFKKLRNIAMVMAEKKKEKEKKMKIASEFVEQEAQEGSDNEDHDDMIKKIDRDAEDKEYEGVDLDQDLAELIDNAVDINEENQFEAFRKYLEDIKIKDREEIKQIIRGEFRKKHEDLQELEDMHEDDKKRQERMQEFVQWMQKREQIEENNLYVKDPDEQRSNSNSDANSIDDDFERKEREKQQEEQFQPEPIVSLEVQNQQLERYLDGFTLTKYNQNDKQSMQISIGKLPESMKRQKSQNLKAISMSGLSGSSANMNKQISLKNTNIIENSMKNPSTPNKMLGGVHFPIKVKKTSSFVNEIMNKNNSSKTMQKTLFGKMAKK